jgi:hypothetical protein
MAWTTPRTWVSGELVTASLFNTHLRDNFTSLDGGRLAITSQAAGDVVYASSSTALARLGTSAGDVLYSTGSAVARLAADNGKFLKSGTSAPAWDTVSFAGLSPLTTRGDVLYSSSGTVTGARLAVGGSNTFLKSDGTDVAWASITFASLSPLSTRGDILYASSGAVNGTRLPIGAANTFLKSDGTDVSWASPPGALSLVGRTEASSGSVAVAVSPTVNRHLMVWNGLQTDTDDNGYQIKVSASGAVISANYSSINYGYSTGGSTLISGMGSGLAGVDGCLFGSAGNGMGNATGEHCSGYCWIVSLDSPSAPVVHLFNGAASYINSGGVLIHVTISGHVDLLGAMDAVNLVPEAGNLDGGFLSLYKVNI